MFEKFGEFDSCEEINRAAEAQLKEGDIEALKELAAENGFDPMDAEDYFCGALDFFCGPKDAALGKLKIEKEELKLEREFVLLEEELEKACMGDKDLAAGVRKKGKCLAEYLAKVIDKGFEQAVTPPKEILQYVKAVPQRYRDGMKTGMPDKATRMEIMKEYYGA